VAPPTYTGTDRLTPDVLYAAIEKVRAAPIVERGPWAISPAAHDMVNDLLDRPHNTPVTHADMARALGALYDRCTPEEKRRLVGETLAAAPW
jgi:hypothetical protein